MFNNLIKIIMKVKTKLIGAAALLGAAMLVNANIGTNEKSQDVLLTDLVNATEANAECGPQSPMNNGRCSELTGNCYWDWPDYHDCDSNGSWGGGMW